MIDTNLKELCFKYFSGTASAEEERAIMSFLSSDKAAMQSFREWESEWKRQQSPSVKQLNAYSHLSKAIRQRRRKKIAFRTLAVSTAAAAAVALFFVVTPLGRIFRTAPAELISETTGFSEIRKVVLPDSTCVWLNSSSELVYDSGFSAENRNVSIEGEAYFEVTKSQRHPFTVSVGGHKITVMGTKFNVTAYPGIDEISTVLLEGKVCFSAPGMNIEMKPGDQVECVPSTSVVIRRTVDPYRYVSWMDGKLDFEAITLPDLLKRLEYQYGVKFNYYPQNYADHCFRIILNTSEESISDVLDALTIILPIRWKQSGTDTYCITETDK